MKNVEIMKAPVNRKRSNKNDEVKHRYREVYVMKNEYLGARTLVALFFFKKNNLTRIIYVHFFCIGVIVDSIVIFHNTKILF